MRSARMLLATGAAAAVLALGAPGAYAGDWDQQDSSSKGENSSSYGKDHGKEGKDQGKEGKDWKGKHDKHDWPHGGVHTGGGALTAVGEDEWSKDKGHGKDWKDKHDKPHGGVHTGGGGLAEPSVTTGGLAILAVAGAGLYAARRKKSVASVA